MPHILWQSSVVTDPFASPSRRNCALVTFAYLTCLIWERVCLSPSCTFLSPFLSELVQNRSVWNEPEQKALKKPTNFNQKANLNRFQETFRQSSWACYHSRRLLSDKRIFGNSCTFDQAQQILFPQPYTHYCNQEERHACFIVASICCYATCSWHMSHVMFLPFLSLLASVPYQRGIRSKIS